MVEEVVGYGMGRGRGRWRAVLLGGGEVVKGEDVGGYHGHKKKRVRRSRLLIDFIAFGLGVLPFLDPCLDSIRANFTNGANFATAGSTISSQNTTFFQKGLFKDLLPKEDYFSRALYTFDIGSNDLAGDYYINMSRKNVSAALTDMLNQYAAALKVKSGIIS
ncbi:hypothetical protein MRB53_017384 [Persea americana]|uniref:Uncharacterized protein n=1 Tax=Persea americana TaxID=3435 RepID=A0ACC2M4W3_PERAE|nr:hypothetical protein MRB53_017384 [Persea americana]